MNGENVVVILAGGTGVRLGLDIPKQLVKIAGRPIIEHALATCEGHRDVDEIIVAMTPGYLDEIRAIVRGAGFTKVTQIIEGAETRNGTTLRGLDALGDRDCKVLLHDAVRPLLSERIVSDCFAALDSYDAVDVAIPSADTIIEVNPDNTVRDIPRRATLRRGQTPQGFRASVLRKAYELAARDPGFEATDDCTVVLRYLPDVPIWIVPGHERNMKVTEPIDVFLADKLFQLTSQEAPMDRANSDYRNALAGKTMVVFGGSYGIGANIAALAAGYGANVCTFSRSTTRTHVERRADVAAAAAQVMDQFGAVDFVVNSAAILPRGDLADTSEETIYSATEINYVAPILIAQEFFPHLAVSRGSILFFTSSSYTRGRGGYSLYSSAKAAVVNLTQALADEWSDHGVRVNCMSPERTRTPMRTQAFGEEPAGSLLEPSAVARACLNTLLSSHTGHVIDLRQHDPFARPLVETDEELGATVG